MPDQLASSQLPTPPASCAGAAPLVECLRRLLLAGGVLAALWMLLVPAQALLRVRTVDWAKRHKDKPRPFAPAASLEEYVANETQGRLVRVRGDDWEAFVRSVRETLAGQAPSLARNLCDDYGSYSLYFPPDTPPLHALSRNLQGETVFTYVLVDAPAGVRYLEVLRQGPSDFTRHAPAWLAYPMRRHAVWFFLAGLLGYALLPWHRTAPNELRYSTARANVLPDLLGTAMAAVFFALPILILTANVRGPRGLDLLDFDGGWGVLTLVLWAFAAGGLSILFVSLRYATTSLFLLDEGLARVGLAGGWQCRFDDIEAIEPAVLRTPRWLRVLLFVGGLFNWRLMGQALLAQARQSTGMTLCCRDGRRLTLWFDSLEGFDRLFHALRRAGVPMDADLAEAIDDAGEPSPRAPGRAGRVVAWVLLLLAAGGALWLHYRPVPTPMVQKRVRFTREALAERVRLTRQMEELTRQMKALAASHDDAPARSDVLGKLDALLRQHRELEKRYEAIVPEEEE